MSSRRSWMVLPALLLGAIALLSAVPEGKAEPAAVALGGTVEGRVFFTGGAPEPERIRVTKDPQVCGGSKLSEEFIVSPDGGGLKNVVVLILGVGEAPEPSSIEIDQEGCVYVPHVQVATPGATLLLTNNDATLHNVHGYLMIDEDSRRTVFNIAQPAPQDPASPISTRRQLRFPGVYRIECDVHPWMLSHVIVHENSFYAITDESGGYTIPDVPPGTYTVQIWHEGLGMVERSITVTEGRASTLDLPIEPNE